jgi:hypothetical protein
LEGVALHFFGMTGFAVGIDGAFGEEVGTATGADEDEPAVAVNRLGTVAMRGLFCGVVPD